MTINEFIKDQSLKGIIYSTDIESTLDNLKNTTSLFLEFKDSTASYDYDTDEFIPSSSGDVTRDNGIYTKELSPLFFDKVIHEDGNKEFLDTVLSFVPYYHLTPTDDIDSAGEPMLVESRDLGINDVPSPMQNNAFWSTWFRDAWGYIQNKFILNIYDKLQYPYITENQYMNSFLFSDMADSIFEDKPEVDEDEYIGFMNTEEENDSVYDESYEYYGEEIGCLDYINDIVNQKLLSNYSIIDYTDKQSTLLSKWSESVYKSGQLDTSELDREITIFKLQDIKNELLRRKFAGSRTLYNLAINSIDRQGSFVTTIKAYDLPSRVASSDNTFNNKRAIRVLRIPGILTQYADFEDTTVNLIDTYFDTIPINTLTPLFYTSAPQSLLNDGTTSPFRTDQFLGSSSDSASTTVGYYISPKDIRKFSTDGTLTVASIRNAFLRENSNTINWNSLQGVIVSSNIDKGYETLDNTVSSNKRTDTFYDYQKAVWSTGELEHTDVEVDDFRSLDSEYEDTTEGTTYPFCLDISHSVLDINLISGGVADVNSDKLLYHKNSLQSTSSDYPYLTYPITGGNSVSLMDTYWLNYIEQEAREKSKVQDNTEIGTQLNTIHSLGYYNDTVEHHFFGISYTNSEETTDLSNVALEEWNNQRYALIWYCTLTYDINTFDVKPKVNTSTYVERKLIAKISLKVDEEDISDDLKDLVEGQYVVRDEHKKYTQFNLGILPLTFSTAVDDAVWTNTIGFYEPVNGKYTKVKNDLDKLSYSEAYFVFAESDILKNSKLAKISLFDEEDDEPLTEYEYPLRISPSQKTKVVYYVIRRDETYEYQAFKNGGWVYDEEGQGRAEIKSKTEKKFYWSDPISVVPLTSAMITGFTKFEPDWINLNYHLNPYMNFTQECASALNKKSVEPSVAYESLTLADTNLLIGPSKFAGLSNLTRMRSLGFACNDNGQGLPMEWTTSDSSSAAKSIYGLFLKRYRPSSISKADVNAEYTSIYGDNREVDAFDEGFDTIVTYLDKEVEELDPGEIGVLYILKFSPDPTTGETRKTEYKYWTGSSYEDVSSQDLSSTRTEAYKDTAGMNCIKLVSNLKEEDSAIWHENYLRIVPVDNLYLYPKESDCTKLTDCPKKTGSKSVKDCYVKVLDTTPITGKDNFTWVKCADDDVLPTGASTDDYFYMFKALATQPQSGTSVYGYYYRDENNDKWIECGIDDIAYQGTTYFESKFVLADTSDYSLIGTSSYTKYPNYTNKIYDSNNNIFDWDKWYWNKDCGNGKTVCINIEFDKECLYTTTIKEDKSVVHTGKEVLLANDTGFKLYVKGQNEVSSIADLKYQIIFKVGTEKICSDDLGLYDLIKNPSLGGEYDRNVRISASAVPNNDTYTLYLVVDNKAYTPITGVVQASMKSQGIDLFCKYEQNDSGKIIKDGNKYIQSNCLLGTVYDLRLYNEGKSLYELELLNKGSFRELFSYSPSTYKLAYSVYQDVTFMKTINDKGLNGDLSGMDINAIRVFNRSIWDSIMIDPHPVTTDERNVSSLYYLPNALNPRTDTDVYRQSPTIAGEYWLNDCVEQELLDNYEVYNGINPFDNDNNQPVYIEYNRNKQAVSLSENDQVTLVNALIEPVNYDEDIIESENLGFVRDPNTTDEFIIKQRPIGSETGYDFIYIPYNKDSSDDCFKYTADISPNFRLTTESDLSRWLSRGTNISLEYNSLLDKPVARLTDVTKYSSASNNILIPLIIPKQDAETGNAYLDKFYLKDIVLNNGLTYFLKASSYYNEIQIPVAAQSLETTYPQVEEVVYTETTDLYPKYNKLYYYNLSKTTPDTYQITGFATGTTYYTQDNPTYASKYTYDSTKTLYVKVNNQWITMEDFGESFFRDDYEYSKSSTGDNPFVFTSGVPVYILVNSTYTMCIRGALPVNKDYYVRNSSTYTAVTETSPIEGKTYYYLDTTYKMFTGNKFSVGVSYYEDILTEEKYYYQKTDGTYELTNIGYPAITTFKAWNEQVDKDLYTRERKLTSKYYNKFDAIRVLKEGTYYFTGKYPFQIIPFADDLIDASCTTNFTTYYGSCRFKVVVSCTPVEYTGSYDIYVKTEDTEYNSEKTYYTLGAGRDIYNQFTGTVFVAGTTYFEKKNQSFDIDGYPVKYLNSNLESTLKSSDHRLSPEDNKTFPHMKVVIDLYVMDTTASGSQSGIAGQMIATLSGTSYSNYEYYDNYTDLPTVGTTGIAYLITSTGKGYVWDNEYVDKGTYSLNENYTFKWNLIASNSLSEDALSRGVILLDKNTLESGTGITANVPMFMEKNYLSSFFVAKRVKGSLTDNPESADDDLIDPIKIDFNSNSTSEKLVSFTETDMDKQVLIAGRSYKILFDYTAKTPEISFIDSTSFDDATTYSPTSTYNLGDMCIQGGIKYTCIDKISTAESWNKNKWEPSIILKDDEKVNYSRLSNLLDTDKSIKEDYSYTTNGQSYSKTDIKMNNYNSGFDVDSTGNWKTSAISNNDFYLGNPYSRSSNKNYLLQIKNTDTRTNSRQNINNSYSYPYVVKNGPSDQNIPANITSLGVITTSAGDFRIRDFDEADILKAHFDDMASSSINSIRSNACGLFLGLSSITPNYIKSFKTGLDNEDIKITPSTHDLYGYMASTRTISVRNGSISINRTSLYSNNILTNNSFDNKSTWITSPSGTWVSDDNWGQGKDVYQFTGNNITLKYLSGDIVVESMYEAAISVKGNNLTVKATFYYKNNKSAEITLTKSTSAVHTGWYVYAGETSDVISADTIVFNITSTTSQNICITKAVVRKCNNITHNLGLYDALNSVTSESTSSKVSILSHNMVVLKDVETGEYIPIQFNNEVFKTVSADGKVVVRPKSGQFRVGTFISKYSLDDYTSSSRLSKLLPPWLRRMHCTQEQDADSHGSQATSNMTVTTVMHAYKVDKNDLGIRVKRESYLPSTDLYDAANTVIHANRSTSEEDRISLYISSMPALVNDNNEFETYNVNLKLDEEDTLTVSEERFSMLFNCFNPTKYRTNQNYSVGVTNIQLLRNQDNTASTARSYEKREIVYEFEFLPIVYSEVRNHLSVNILLYKKNTINTTGA